jgi:orotate phosphoribosyltransferase-like protein
MMLINQHIGSEGNMDIEEFVQGVQPKKKRSRLLPFREQIMTLKSQGYTDLQISEWLALNKLEVSREAVRKFVAKQTVKQSANSTQQIPQAEPTGTDAGIERPETTEPAKQRMNQAEKIRAKLEEQKREAESKHFKHDKTGNL